MRLVTLVTAIALGLGGLAATYLYHGEPYPPQRYGSWQELTAAQPSCKSMTNLSEPAGPAAICRFDTACQPADGHFAAALASMVSAFNSGEEAAVR